MKLRRTGTILAVAWLVTTPSVGPSVLAQEALPLDAQMTPADCHALVGQSFTAADGETAEVLSATVVPASGDVPDHCSVSGSIGGRITFNLRAPMDQWDGRYVQVGGGGFCGTVPTLTGAGDPYLRIGSAVASNDTGHVGSPFNAEWAYENDQAKRDWGYLSEQLNAGASKAILATLYGEPASYAYFLGCSTGGRQALMLAQRSPDAFDGIVAGAPANFQNYLAVLSQGYRERVNRNPDGTLILRQSDAAVVADAVLEACDALDGVEDGVVSDPRACDFDLSTLRCPESGPADDCLTDEQVEVLAKWYDDPRNSDGTSLYPGGVPAGSEAGWNLTNITADGPAYSFGGMFADQVLKYLAFAPDAGPTYRLEDFDFDADPERLHERARIYNADDPDMSAFRDAGGKLILWHGFHDPLITPFASIEFYEDTLAAMGGLDEVSGWYRLFLPPGVYHCSGGPGPDRIDWYSAIVDWAEQDVEPDRLVASGAGMTRPVFPYPVQAAYAGGDPADEGSFVPAEGPRGRSGGPFLGSRREPAAPEEGQGASPPADDPQPTPPDAATALPATGTSSVPTAVGLLLALTALLVGRRRA